MSTAKGYTLYIWKWGPETAETMAGLCNSLYHARSTAVVFSFCCFPIIWCFNASEDSFGFRLNLDILSSLYVVLMTKNLWGTCSPYLLHFSKLFPGPYTDKFCTLTNITRDSTLLCFKNCIKGDCLAFNAYHTFIQCRE